MRTLIISVDNYVNSYPHILFLSQNKFSFGENI